MSRGKISSLGVHVVNARSQREFSRLNGTDLENTYRGTRKFESRVRRVFVIPGKRWEKPKASVANAAKAPCEMMPCG